MWRGSENTWEDLLLHPWGAHGPLVLLMIGKTPSTILTKACCNYGEHQSGTPRGKMQAFLAAGGQPCHLLFPSRHVPAVTITLQSQNQGYSKYTIYKVIVNNQVPYNVVHIGHWSWAFPVFQSLFVTQVAPLCFRTSPFVQEHFVCCQWFAWIIHISKQLHGPETNGKLWNQQQFANHSQIKQETEPWKYYSNSCNVLNNIAIKFWHLEINRVWQTKYNSVVTNRSLTNFRNIV